MKVFVIGADGFLGNHICSAIQDIPGLEVVSIFHSKPPEASFSLTTPLSTNLNELFRSVKPNIVLNCAGQIGNPKDSNDRVLMYETNVNLTKTLITNCKNSGAKLLHFSTASVFDGTKQGLYIESDPTKPLNYYGETKAISENIALQLPNSTILRTMKLIGWDPKRHRGFAEKVLAGGVFFNSTKLQFTLVNDVAETVKTIISSPKIYTGIYHLSSARGYTQFELANKIKDGVGLKSKIESVDGEQNAPPGPNIIFKINKAKKVGFPTSDIETAIPILRSDFEISNNYREGNYHPPEKK